VTRTDGPFRPPLPGGLGGCAAIGEDATRVRLHNTGSFCRARAR